jgi:hypothetical protein
MINPSVVAAIRVVSVRGDPCGAVRWTVYGWSQVESWSTFKNLYCILTLKSTF